MIFNPYRVNWFGIILLFYNWPPSRSVIMSSIFISCAHPAGNLACITSNPGVLRYTHHEFLINFYHPNFWVIDIWWIVSINFYSTKHLDDLNLPVSQFRSFNWVGFHDSCPENKSYEPWLIKQLKTSFSRFLFTFRESPGNINSRWSCTWWHFRCYDV